MDYFKKELIEDYYGVKKKYLKKLWELPRNKFYYVKNDLQGGNFGKERIFSIKDWACQAIEWLYMDDSEMEQDWLLENTIENIGDYWNLEFEEITITDLEKMVQKIKTDLKIMDTWPFSEIKQNGVEEFLNKIEDTIKELGGE